MFAIISKKAVVSYYYYILHNYHCTKKTHFYGCDYVSKSNKKAILIRILFYTVDFKNIAIDTVKPRDTVVFVSESPKPRL